MITTMEIIHINIHHTLSEGFPWDDLRKIFTKGSQMAKVPNGVETLRKISIA